MVVSRLDRVRLRHNLVYMILDILLGLSLLAVLVLLRVVFLWGHAKGELDEYNRTRPFDWKE